MELPHLTLALRRLQRTPGRLAVVFLLFWLVLTVMESLRPGWLEFFIDNILRGAQWNLGEQVVRLLATFGFFCVYYLIAAAMRSVSDQAAGGEWGWFTSPLSNHAVLAGVLLAALAMAVVPVCGVLAFGSEHTWNEKLYTVFTGPVGFQLGLEFDNLKTFTLFFLMRLPHFALATGVLHLAWRSTSLAPWVTPLTTLVATAVHFWVGRYLFDLSVCPNLAGPQPWFWWLVGLAGTIIIGWLAVRACHTRRFSVWHFGLLVVLWLVPFQGGVIGAVSDYQQPVWSRSGNIWYHPGTIQYYAYSAGLIPFQATVGNVFPAIESVYVERSSRTGSVPRQMFRGLMGFDEQSHWYATPVMGTTHYTLAILGYLISLVLWWTTAVLCLRAVRYPSRPLFGRRRRD